MKALVYVTLKPSVLDPQGQTIRSALNTLGHRQVLSVRQGKYFELEFDDNISGQVAVKDLEEIARDVLSNGVIEDYRVEVVDGTGQ